VILLVRGPTDDPADDEMLEVKEIVDSGIAGLYPPGVYHDDVARRIVETSRGAWARQDAEPFWGVTDWLGLPCQIKHETQGQKGVKVSRLVKDRGTPEAIGDLATALGTVLARIHVSGPHGNTNAQAISKRIAADPQGFVAEQAEVAVMYAEASVADQALFLHLLRDRGLRLGVPFDPADAPRPDLAALYGVPPLPLPLPPIP
jgi:hypothetical protein